MQLANSPWLLAVTGESRNLIQISAHASERGRVAIGMDQKEASVERRRAPRRDDDAAGGGRDRSPVQCGDTAVFSVSATEYAMLQRNACHVSNGNLASCRGSLRGQQVSFCKFASNRMNG
jgi:hypothetical protein